MSSAKQFFLSFIWNPFGAEWPWHGFKKLPAVRAHSFRNIYCSEDIEWRSPKTVVPKLFCCAEHYKYFCVQCSTTYWFVGIGIGGPLELISRTSSVPRSRRWESLPWENIRLSLTVILQVCNFCFSSWSPQLFRRIIVRKMLKFLLFTILLNHCRHHVEAFCWEPGTSPFTGPPKSIRLPEGDRIQVSIHYWRNSNLYFF